MVLSFLILMHLKANHKIFHWIKLIGPDMGMNCLFDMVMFCYVIAGKHCCMKFNIWLDQSGWLSHWFECGRTAVTRKYFYFINWLFVFYILNTGGSTTTNKGAIRWDSQWFTLHDAVTGDQFKQ